jgi:hypothetical protein
MRIPWNDKKIINQTLNNKKTFFITQTSLSGIFMTHNSEREGQEEEIIE